MSILRLKSPNLVTSAGSWTPKAIASGYGNHLLNNDKVRWDASTSFSDCNGSASTRKNSLRGDWRFVFVRRRRFAERIVADFINAALEYRRVTCRSRIQSFKDRLDDERCDR